MDTNISAWMIAGGPRIESVAEAREREQLHAFRESERAARAGEPSRIGLIGRLRAIVRPGSAATDLACCPA